MQKIVNTSITKLDEVTTALDFIYDEFPDDEDIFDLLEQVITKLEGVSEKIKEHAEQDSIQDEED
tara:strand:+ start:123 stop:317 length:195 start_codon:yes stop_codon:yes gene_type:complete